MTKEIKFRDHKKANCKMYMINDEILVLQSYNTIIASCDINGWIECRGTYSRTTIKHIGWFARECKNMLETPISYFDYKSVAGKRVRYNVLQARLKIIKG